MNEERSSSTNTHSSIILQIAMEAQNELCDLIAQEPVKLADKLAWICTKCPPPGSTSSITLSQLNALLAIARLLSKCPNLTDSRPKSIILDFLQSTSASFSPSFWPQTYGLDSVSIFFSSFLNYVVKATELSGDFAEEVARFVGEIVFLINSVASDDRREIYRVFFLALSQNCPSVLSSDAERLVSFLLSSFSIATTSKSAPAVSDSVSSSYTSSSKEIEISSPGNEVSNVSRSSSTSGLKEADSQRSPNSSVSVNGGGSSTWNLGFNDGTASRQQISLFEEESVDNLEKQVVALRLIGHIMDKVPVKHDQMDEIRKLTVKQLHSLLFFLKIRDGAMLKTRVILKLSVYQAAASVQVKSIASLDSDSKSSKKSVQEALALLIGAAELCLYSNWRGYKLCEELFTTLLKGIVKIAVTRDGQQLQVLFMRLKSFVKAACAQAKAWGGSQGTMFMSVIATCHEIIDFGWSKDHGPVETFVTGLAAKVRERDDFEEQEDRKEKQTIPSHKLNIIRLLANLNVSLNKSEVVDMVLPLFIESLEEGDASTPSSLRLELLNTVSHMASLGFEKSYRETVVLMTRSYMTKLANVGSVESKTLAPEATTERLEGSF